MAVIYATLIIKGSRTGGAKVGGDPYYLSEDNLQ